MATPEPCKYRAFLSYSHRNTAAAKRLHGRLEGFRIDKDLVGRETPMGPIPKHLRPIFRDRHDFDAGGALAAQTIAALNHPNICHLYDVGSNYLVVELIEGEPLKGRSAPLLWRSTPRADA